mmetsp:Transcript_53365/g.116504  ORF Transcript_53365/g.116504 Transcript_53365/m.116504 type:complete len:217 (+) Transcript_53365:420-1070(+)
MANVAEDAKLVEHRPLRPRGVPLDGHGAAAEAALQHVALSAMTELLRRESHLLLADQPPLLGPQLHETVDVVVRQPIPCTAVKPIEEQPGLGCRHRRGHIRSRSRHAVGLWVRSRPSLDGEICCSEFRLRAHRPLLHQGGVEGPVLELRRAHAHRGSEDQPGDDEQSEHVDELDRERARPEAQHDGAVQPDRGEPSDGKGDVHDSDDTVRNQRQDR